RVDFSDPRPVRLPPWERQKKLVTCTCHRISPSLGGVDILIARHYHPPNRRVFTCDCVHAFPSDLLPHAGRLAPAGLASLQVLDRGPESFARAKHVPYFFVGEAN